jgi:pilus assembly protein CpaF
MTDQAVVRSPLVAIEHRVQQRAKDLSIDVGTDAGKARLRELVALEVAHWSDQYRRGRRPFDLADPETLASRAFRNLAGYGPLEALLADDDVWEIMINAPDAIFVKRHRGASGYHGEVFHDDDHVLRTLTKILDDSSTSHRKLDPAEGLQDAQLDTGARIHIVHADVARDGHVLVNIRLFTGVAFKSLEELVDLDMLDARVASFLRACVRAGTSIVFSGAPGSGKTTMLSCCAAELDAERRVVTAEEVFEADVPLANVASMQTRPARLDREEVDLRRLVAGFLRMAPDVAIVGEVRDREALPLLLTLSSGVKGFTTIHSGSGRQALSRLRFVAQLAEGAGGLPMAALNALVSEAIDIVVHCTRTSGIPRVAEVLAVEEPLAGPEATAFTVTEVFTRARHDGPLDWTGALPVRLARILNAAGADVRQLVDDARGSSGDSPPPRTRRPRPLVAGRSPR